MLPCAATPSLGAAAVFIFIGISMHFIFCRQRNSRVMKFLPSDSALTIAIGANNQQVLWMLPNESQLDEEGVAIVRLVVAARCGNSKSTAVRFFNWIFLSTAETTPFLLYPSYTA